MVTKTDINFLKMAIDNSKRSSLDGNFPAGSIVVQDGDILASEVSSPYPGLFHADSKAVQQAFEKHGILTDAILYVGLEPCLMCLGVAYWSGIRRIVYAVSKSKVSGDYYETHKDISDLVTEFNDPIEMVHVQELENIALSVINEWEDEFIKK